MLLAVLHDLGHGSGYLLQTNTLTCGVSAVTSVLLRPLDFTLTFHFFLALHTASFESSKQEDLEALFQGQEFGNRP